MAEDIFTISVQGNLTSFSIPRVATLDPSNSSGGR